MEACRFPLAGGAFGAAQMRMGMTTYLNPVCSGIVINTLELVSCNSIFTISWLMLLSASIK